MPDVDPFGRWIREPTNGRALLFIHGFFSNSGSAWRSGSAFWPDLIIEESDLQGYGVYVFDYCTSMTSRTYSLADASEALDWVWTNRLGGLHQIIYVAHSVGGIVSRHHLVSREHDFADSAISIGLFLLASPSVGAHLANVLKRLCRIYHAQLDGLRFTDRNMWLMDLDRRFMRLRDRRRFRLLGKELIEANPVYPRLHSKLLSMALRLFMPPVRVVSEAEASRYFADRMTVAGSDHLTIAKPHDRNAEQHQLLKAFVLELKASACKIPPDRQELVRNISDPGRCDGREHQIDILVDTVTTKLGNGKALILGGPGFGKTTLALKVASDDAVIERFGCRRWLVRLETVQSGNGIIEAIAATIGVNRNAGISAVLAQLRRAPTLLVLDNLETPRQHDKHRTEAVLKELRAAHVPLALIACVRGDEPLIDLFDRWVRLHRLSDPISRKLFVDIAQNISERDANFGFVLQWAAGVPLFLRLLARRAAIFPNLARLRAILDSNQITLFDEKLRKCIEVSLESPVLQEPGRRLFALLGRLPAGMAQEDQDALLGAVSYPAEEQLRAVGLLEDQDGRIDLLPPIREVALNSDIAADDGSRWVRHYMALAREQGARVGRDGGEFAVARLIDETPNINAAILDVSTNSDGRSDAIAILRGGLSRALFYGDFPADAMLTTLARRCRAAGERMGEAVCLISRATAARVRNEHERALVLLSQVEGLLRDVPDERLQASRLQSVAQVAKAQDKFDHARQVFQEAQTIWRSQSDGRIGEADCLWGLAEIELKQHRSSAEALKLYTSAQELYRQECWLIGDAACFWAIAELQRLEGHYEQARNLYYEAIPRYIGAGWGGGEAFCLFGLAQTAEASTVGREEVCALYVRAEAQFRKTSQTDWVLRAGHKIQELGCSRA